ncbi:MAG: hypothetical protein KKD21_03130 [Proteobacteria bacterium]|nr:hypothetical protein [Pseudomonadota bacterium]MBU1696022.1 hypothetical protein [Pseudomonadota bacterium]
MIKNNFTIKFFAVLSFLILSSDTSFANWPDRGTMVEGYHMMGTGMGWMMFLPPWFILIHPLDKIYPLWQM